MKPQWQVKLTLPEKGQSYTQDDMDVVVGHPVNLTMNVVVGNSARPMPMVGTITAAEIQPDGSAVVTMDVSAS